MVLHCSRRPRLDGWGLAVHPGRRLPILRQPEPGNARQLVTARASAAVGIDLGTTTSAVAVLNPSVSPRPYIVPNALIPSVVHFAQGGQVLVGVEAQQAGLRDPANTFSSVKRLMGRSAGEMAAIAAGLPYRLAPVAGPGEPARCHCPARGGAAMLPEEVLSHLIASLCAKAQAHLGGGPITEAVITLPACFTPQQAAATVAAGRLAGLSRVTLLQEPIAAAMAHGYGGPRSERSDTLLVVDLGGGTYDVSLLDGFEGIMEVLGSDGDAMLGGDDFTRALADWAAAQLGAAGAAEEVEAEKAGGRSWSIIAAAEAAKVALSSSESALLRLPQHPAGQVTLTRRQLQEVCAPLRQRLWAPLQRLAKATKAEFAGPLSGTKHASSSGSSAGPYAAPPRRLTGIVLVGAATRMPLVREFVAGVTGLAPRGAGAQQEGQQQEHDPEEVVALGAALQAAVLGGLATSGLELMDGSYVWQQHGRAAGLASWAP